MKRLDLAVYEPGEHITTCTATGDLKFWVVKEDGGLLQPNYGPLAAPPPRPFDADTPIEDLTLSVRTYNLLKREGWDTLGEVAGAWDRLGRDGLSDIRNFGTNSVDEVQNAVAAARGQIEIIPIEAKGTEE